tara:strand:+ start:1996 stop:2427 length:432 start_codon:yes stop_codon:yes gene_type:complete
MKYKEENKDLFSVDFDKYTLAHCISLDCKMGAGIAVPIKKKFNLGGLYQFLNNMAIPVEHPICIFYNKAYNLITKEKYWHKPTYETMAVALTSMMLHANQHIIRYIAMPRIGSGLDKLSWEKVREIIKEVFKNTDISILVCYI